MTVIGCVLYVAVLLLAGYALLCACGGSRRWNAFELMGLSLLLGAGAIGMVLFWLSLAGVRTDRVAILSLGGAALAAVLAMRQRHRLARPGGGNEGPLTSRHAALTIPVLMLAFGLVFVACASLMMPLYEWDAYAIWGLKAKALSAESLASRPGFFYEPALVYSHQDYPLMTPFLTAGVYGMIGEIDDRVGKLVGVVLYAGLMAMTYGFLRRRFTRLASASLAALLLCLPEMLRWSSAGTADAALAVFHAGAIFYAVLWLRERRSGDLALAGLFNAFTAFTKSEGLGMALILALVVGGAALAQVGSRRKRILSWAAWSAGTLMLLLPWLLFRAGLPKSGEDYGARLTPGNIMGHLDQLSVVVPGLAGQILAWKLWGPLWLLLIAMTVLGWRALRRGETWMLCVLFVLHVAMYACAYLVTPIGAANLMPGTVDRLLLHTTPGVVLLIGVYWSHAAPKSTASAIGRASEGAPSPIAR